MKIKLPATQQQQVQEPLPALRLMKLGLAISLGLNALLVAWLLTRTLSVAVVAPQQPSPIDDAPNPNYTQQDIGRSVSVTAGMSMASVKELLGDPVVKEIAGGREEWHYCRTGKRVDEYVVITFSDQKVGELQYYTVHLLDLLSHYAEQSAKNQIPLGGDCRLTVRWGTYSQRTPCAPLWPKNPEVPAVGASR